MKKHIDVIIVFGVLWTWVFMIYEFSLSYYDDSLMHLCFLVFQTFMFSQFIGMAFRRN